MGACRYFCNAIAVALLSSGAFYVYKYIGLPDWYWQSKLPPDVEALDAADTTRLKHVLFSGEPWLIQCYSGLPYYGQHLPAPYRLHPTFTESLGSLKGLVKGGTLDCEKKLPTNKTLVSKFGLVRRTQPLLLFAGGGDRPRQVPTASASSAYGVMAWVKPKAEPQVRVAKSQKALEAYCGGRRACLLSKLPADSGVLEQLATKYRTVEVVSIGGGTISWGRGEEVGETLEEEEAKHFGAPTALLRADPEAPRATRKGARPAPRLLRGFVGSEDLPSLSRFVEKALDAPVDEEGGFVRSPLPTLTAPAKPKKKPKEVDPAKEAERQAKRARARAEARKKEEAAAAEKAEQLKASTAEQRAAQQQDAERRRREQMASEEAQASNIVEEMDGEEGDEAGDDDDIEEVDEWEEEEEEEDDGSDVLDIDS
jgi:hypothetical protein